ncbi:MAG: hypothetical protein JRI68_14250 [Deltaproteobacteria bacterium]|nr:hypothetical protein [Deltaproteobacteria bacterium]
MSTPLATAKERFDSKEKLVAAVEELMTDELWLPRLSKDRGGARDIKHVSNSKLLKLHALFTQVKDEFGTRAKLVDAVLEAEGRAKDTGYRGRLEGYPVARLYDLLQGAKKRAKK